MRKYLFPLFTFLLLSLLTACQGLNNKTGLITVKFPDGMGARLAREAEKIEGAGTASENGKETPFEIKVYVTGDFQSSQTVQYNNFNEIDGAQIQISDIPVDSIILVSLEISKDEEVIFKGISESILVKAGNNYADITLESCYEPEEKPETTGINIIFNYEDEYYDLLINEENSVEFNVYLYDEKRNVIKHEEYSQIQSPDWYVVIGEKVSISAELKINGKVLYIGNSELLEITYENNTVEIELVPQYEKNTIELDFAQPVELKIISNGEVITGTEVPFTSEIAIVAFQGENQVTFENKNVVWTINGHSIPSDGLYGCWFDSNYKNQLTIDSETLVNHLNSDKYLVRLLVSDGDNSASAYLEFTYMYEIPTIEGTDTHGDYNLGSTNYSYWND